MAIQSECFFQNGDTMKDLHSVVRSVVVVAPVAVGTTGTGKTGKVIDTQGYGGVEFLVAYGTVTATNAVITVTCLEGAVTGTLTSVADGDLQGTELLAGLAAPGAGEPSAAPKEQQRARSDHRTWPIVVYVPGHL